MKPYFRFLGILLIAFILGACSKEYRTYNKWAQKGTISQKDSAAGYFFSVKKDYDKAAFLYEELMGAMRASSRAEHIMYRYAWCKYNLKEYVSASYWFDQFIKQYPNSLQSEEALYMECMSFYKQSDPAYLDQAYTNKALEMLQQFVDTYPLSDRVQEAESVMKELRERKADKAFNTAKLYYKTYNFKGAIRAFQVLMEEYPESKYREESQFLMVKSAVLLADQSTEAKKVRRYKDALEYYQKFVDRYPNSNYLREAESYFNRAEKALEKLQPAISKTTN